ncbi:unnamed protein product [Brassica rapa subsp. narinosa]|uniref:(rape) hypothetical protein n=1 Tax=Brassica napus TaxID=3708 RepID=A0A816X2A5_BRANA|nr:unnamed protein product [Brassica napus]
MCPMSNTFTSEIKPNPSQKPNIKPNTENIKLINQKTFVFQRSRQNRHRLTLLR